MSSTTRKRCVKSALENVCKKKRVCLTVGQKRTVISSLAEGTPVKEIADKYGISTRQVYDIRRQKQRLARTARTVEEDGIMQSRKKQRRPVYSQVDDAVYRWFVEQRSQRVPISGPMICAKALRFFSMLSPQHTKPFKASSGWLASFKKRHGIHSLTTQGERMSANVAVIETYVKSLCVEIEQKVLCAEQIYNADETALYWKALPRKTLVAAFEKAAAGRKEPKERVTILACSNATGGHKLKPLLISKYKNPRCLKHINRETLPVIYRHQSKMWMTQEIFSEWFHNYFVPDVKRYLANLNLSPKALLIVDNCSAHPKHLMSEDGNIQCEFLPPNVTSWLQPLDCGVLEAMKRWYRRHFLFDVVHTQEKHETEGQCVTILDLLSSISLYDSMKYVSKAWQSVSGKTIQKAFGRTLQVGEYGDNDGDNDGDNIIHGLDCLKEIANNDCSADALLQIISKLRIADNTTLSAEDMSDWLQSDSSQGTCLPLSDEIIFDDVSNRVTNCSASSDSSPSNGLNPDFESDDPPDDQDAAEAFNTCIRWLEHHGFPDSDFLEIMVSLRDYALRSC